MSEEVTFASDAGGVLTNIGSSKTANAPIILQVLSVAIDQESDRTLKFAKHANRTNSSCITNLFAR